MHSTSYPMLRASLAPDYIELSDEQLDSIVAEIYGPGVSAEDVESFWNDLGRGFKGVAKGVGSFAQRAAPVLGRALPAVAQGALTGASVGGPFGAIAGAVAGGAGGVLSQSKNPTLRGIGGAIGGATRLASGFTGGGALRSLAGVALGGRGGAGGALRGVAGQVAGALGTGPGGGANALLGLLSRPETLRALSSAALGPFGRTRVPVGAQQVPVQSILGALGTLAGRASGEMETTSERQPAYFYGADGELAIDPADSEQRTQALLELYEQTASPFVPELAPESEDGEDVESDEAVYGEADAIYDEWLLATEAESSEFEEDEEYDHA